MCEVVFLPHTGAIWYLYFQIFWLQSFPSCRMQICERDTLWCLYVYSTPFSPDRRRKCWSVLTLNWFSYGYLRSFLSQTFSNSVALQLLTAPAYTWLYWIQWSLFPNQCVLMAPLIIKSSWIIHLVISDPWWFHDSMTPNYGKYLIVLYLVIAVGSNILLQMKGGGGISPAFGVLDRGNHEEIQRLQCLLVFCPTLVLPPPCQRQRACLPWTSGSWSRVFALAPMLSSCTEVPPLLPTVLCTLPNKNPGSWGTRPTGDRANSQGYPYLGTETLRLVEEDESSNHLTMCDPAKFPHSQGTPYALQSLGRTKDMPNLLDPSE